MIKVYIGEVLPDIPHTEILYPNLGNTEKGTPFGEKVLDQFTDKLVDIVSDPGDADYLCIPHNYNYIKDNIDYLTGFEELTFLYKKKVIVFFPGDSSEKVHLEHAIVFRNSQYKSKLRDNEIIMPGYVVDLGKKYGLTIRRKGEKPVIGFCGWAKIKTIRAWVSYILKNMMEGLVGERSHKKGIYFRRFAISLLKKSPKVSTYFILRSSYSGNAKTLEVDPNSARTEYVENMKNSDFILAPRGDGNFSMRLYEALSLGRIPLFIDTDSSLPLEDEINYDEFIIRIDHREMHLMVDKVLTYFSSMTQDEYEHKQKKCREVFEKYLRLDSFFKHTISKEFLL